MFETFARSIKVRYNKKMVGIISDHGTKLKNSRFNYFYNELGINHNFSSPKIP